MRRAKIRRSKKERARAKARSTKAAQAAKIAENDESVALEPEGQGGALPVAPEPPEMPDRTMNRSDMELVRQAIRNNWAIPEDVYRSLPGQVLEIMQCEPSSRYKLSAAKLLISMSAENRANAQLALGAVKQDSPAVQVTNIVTVETNEVSDGQGRSGELAGLVAELRAIGVSLRERGEDDV